MCTELEILIFRMRQFAGRMKTRDAHTQHTAHDITDESAVLCMDLEHAFVALESFF